MKSLKSRSPPRVRLDRDVMPKEHWRPMSCKQARVNSSYRRAPADVRSRLQRLLAPRLRFCLAGEDRIHHSGCYPHVEPVSMRFDDFLLDRWLQKKSGPLISYNLGGSTRPVKPMRDHPDHFHVEFEVQDADIKEAADAREAFIRGWSP